MLQLLGSKKNVLREWIGECLASPSEDHDGKTLSRMACMHMIGSQPEEVHTHRFRPDNSMTAEQLEKLFRGKASAFSQDLPGTQTFCLIPFWGDDVGPRMPFIVQQSAEDMTRTGLLTESPDEKGLAQQAMRHLEAFASQIFARQAVLDNTTQRRIESLDSHNERLEGENRELMKIFFEVLREKAVDMRAEDAKNLEYERQTAERKKWIGMMPALVNQVMGREVMPNASVDSVIVRALAEKLEPAQLEMLGQTGIVSAEAMALLVSRFNEIQDEINEEKRKTSQLEPDVSNVKPEVELLSTKDPESSFARQSEKKAVSPRRKGSAK